MTITDPTPAHVPDVLETLAQLPNDEVYTPPKLVNAMLDVLPDHVWSEPDYKWLDPATKSGVYLREIARRLMVGLAEWEPDGAKRRDHILRHMVYGAAITQMSGEIARRSLYQTKNATGTEIKDPALADLVVHLDTPDGNVPFVPTEHTLDRAGNFCTICRAPAALIRDNRENFAYSFLHGTYPTKELADMKFDVIVGNPPYQIGVEGNNRTRPIYQHFVRRAIEMGPRYVLMITPSRWFTGGLGLDEFRRSMLSDQRISVLVDYPSDKEVFPGVDVGGGISYFLWDREHEGLCEVTTIQAGVKSGPVARSLSAYDVHVRYNESVDIIEKVRAIEPRSIAWRVSAQKPFGLLSSFKGYHASPRPGDVRLYTRGRPAAYVARDAIIQGRELIDSIKVLTAEAADGNGYIPATVTGNPFVVSGPSVCTQTYLVAGVFDSTEEATNYAAYLRTKFVRFLVHQRKATQHTTSDAYLFVPDVPLDQIWTDAKLYARFALTNSEIAYIEGLIKAMSDGDADAPVAVDTEDGDDE